MYNGAESYFENGVMSADPVELVRMLYRGGIEAVEKARQHLCEGDIAARSAQITRAGAIIAHLTFSVNRDADPALGAKLVELYDYMQRQLLRANLEQADGPLAEVARLLSTMLDAWAACGPGEAGAVETAPAWGLAAPEPVEVPSAGIYSQTVDSSLYTGRVDAALYGKAVGVGAGVYPQAGRAETAGAGAYGQTVDGGVYSPTFGAGAYAPMTSAGAYAPATGAGAYAQTDAVGGCGDQEQELEYAGQSWDF